jgi:Ca2+-binding RTX toxin-like protein
MHGANVIAGGAGADTIRGGSGTDTADYSASASAVTVNLATNVNTGGDAQGDSLSAHREYHRLGSTTTLTAMPAPT